jgi:hypothetical protein
VAQARPVWAAIALTPVLWLLVVAVGVLMGDGPRVAGVARVGDLLLYLVALSAPTAAVLLGLEEQPTAAPHKRAVLVIAVLLLAGTFVVLPAFAVAGVGLEWLLAAGLVLAVLARYGGQLPTRAGRR